MSLDRGSVVLVDLEPTRGHEQRGVRPCVLVSDREVVAGQRFPLVAVVPVSRKGGEGALYPTLRPEPSGLVETSCALTDQVRSVDKRRVRRLFGKVSAEEMRAIDEGLALFLGLDEPSLAVARPETDA